MTPFRPSSPILLAFTKLHEWLPSSNGSNLSSILTNAGIERVAFLRHGKTFPAPENGIDFDRQLTTVGRDQARQAAASFGIQLKPFFSTVLASPAPRTMETAKLFCEAASECDYKIHCPQVLYDGTMQPEGSKLFQKIGYAPLQDYVNAKDDKDREIAQAVLGEYASQVVQVMMEAVESSPQRKELTDNSSTTLWMVGHAIYLPAAALGVAALLNVNEVEKEVILSTNTAEAEGYLVDVSDGSVRYLARPPASA